MGLFQMVLLLLFNSQITLSVSELSSQSGLAELDTLRSIKVKAQHIYIHIKWKKKEREDQ